VLPEFAQPEIPVPVLNAPELEPKLARLLDPADHAAELQY
jgi:hypothetical protein